jgi:esterase
MILNAVQAGEGQPVVLLHGLFGEARNFGSFQRALAAHFRVVAMDMRNHGASPHAPGMRYQTLGLDVIETMGALGIGVAAVVGDSMGGKAAMAAALTHPDRFGRLLVADIAPVAYQHGNAGIAAAMMAMPLESGLTRARADAALASAVADAGIRAFLLRNLRFDPAPSWRVGLDEIAAAVTDLEGWDETAFAGRHYDAPAWFVTGADSDYVSRDHRPAIRALFPASRFLAVKNAGHWLHADNPAGFLAVLEGFLTGWSRGNSVR